MLLIRVHDEKGYHFIEADQFIDQCISLSNQSQNNILDWLLKKSNITSIYFLS